MSGSAVSFEFFVSAAHFGASFPSKPSRPVDHQPLMLVQRNVAQLSQSERSFLTLLLSWPSARLGGRVSQRNGRRGIVNCLGRHERSFKALCPTTQE